MSDQSLREALDKLLEERGHFLTTFDVRRVLDEDRWGAGKPTADRQPSDAAVEAAYKAASEIWGHGPYAAINAALEAAYRVDAPRPLLDREAVKAVLAKRLHGEQVVDLLMELARPMPTREQIDELLQLWRVGPAHRPHDPKYPGVLPNYRRKLRNAVLALLNGAES